MKKITTYLAFISLLSTLLFSCKPDFDLNAPYRDITVAYAVLNTSDSIQYAQVYKGFQSSGNVSSEAMNMDSIYYFDKVEVALQKMAGDRVVNTIMLDTTTAIPKNPGIFAHPKQLLYYTTEKLDTTDNGVYRLYVRNKETNKETYGNTALVSNFSIVRPYPPEVNMTSYSMGLRFQPAANAVTYHVYLNFYYIEKSLTTGEIVNRGKLTRLVVSYGWRDTYGDELSVDFDPTALYRMIASDLDPDPSVIRYPDYTREEGSNYVEFEMWAADEVLHTYLDLNNPSTSIVQDRLEYTNMVCPTDEDYKTAYGFVASRNRTTQSYRLNPTAMDTLVEGSLTRDLGFERPTE